MSGINLAKQVSSLNRGENPSAPSEPQSTIRSSPLQGFSIDDWSAKDTARLLLFIIGIALIPLGRYIVQDQTEKQAAEIQTQIATLDSAITAEQAKKKNLAEVEREAATYDTKLAELQAKFNAVESVSRHRNLVVRMVDFVVQEMPSSIWLSRVEVDVNKGKKIEVTGNAASLQLVGEFMKRLEGAAFFPNWMLVETTNETVSRSNIPNAPAESKKFAISAEVFKP